MKINKVFKIITHFQFFITSEIKRLKSVFKLLCPSFYVTSKNQCTHFVHLFWIWELAICGVYKCTCILTILYIVNTVNEISRDTSMVCISMVCMYVHICIHTCMVYIVCKYGCFRTTYAYVKIVLRSFKTWEYNVWSRNAVFGNALKNTILRSHRPLRDI